MDSEENELSEVEYNNFDNFQVGEDDERSKLISFPDTELEHLWHYEVFEPPAPKAVSVRSQRSLVYPRVAVAEISEYILEEIFVLLDVPSLLSIRRTCSRWHQIASQQLATRAILHINADGQNTKHALKLKNGKWKGDLIAPWTSVSLFHHPSKPLPIFNFNVNFRRGHKSSLEHFDNVCHLTLIEGDGAFYNFVHSAMVSMHNVRQVVIREYTPNPTIIYRYGFSYKAPFRQIHVLFRTWKKGLENIAKVEALRLKLYDRIAMLVYIKLFVKAKNLHLKTVDLDFSKIEGLPLYYEQVYEIYRQIMKLFYEAALTLKNVRISWCHRLDTEKTLIEAEVDIYPWRAFIQILKTDYVLDCLQLERLVLNFPCVDLTDFHAQDVLLQFLTNHTSLERFYLSRVVWNMGWHRFNTRIPSTSTCRYDYGIFMKDFDRITTTRQLKNSIAAVDFLSFETQDITETSLCKRRRVRRQGQIVQFTRCITHLRFVNSRLNQGLINFGVAQLVDNLPYLRELELIDNNLLFQSGFNAVIDNDDLNLILLRLIHLHSLKLSKTSLLTDMGITGLSELQLKEIGILRFFPVLVNYSAFQEARKLHYLEFRDLSDSVTDVSIFYGFQLIPKLERIALYGKHKITVVGAMLLEERFKRNPYFTVATTGGPKSSYIEDFP